MNIIAGSIFPQRVNDPPTPSTPQRKVEAITRPGMEPPVDVNRQNTASSLKKEKSEKTVKEDKTPETDEPEKQDKSGKVALSVDERRQVEQLSERDQEVRTHEEAHLSAAGNLVQGGARLTYTNGPDGKRYATSGEVSINTAEADTPEATIIKAQRIRAAALAPAKPSAQDLRVSTAASQLAVEARADVAQQLNEKEVVDEQADDNQSSNIKAQFTSRSHEKGESGRIKKDLESESNSEKQPVLIAVNSRAGEYSANTTVSIIGQVVSFIV